MIQAPGKSYKTFLRSKLERLPRAENKASICKQGDPHSHQHQGDQMSDFSPVGLLLKAQRNGYIFGYFLYKQFYLHLDPNFQIII